MRPSILTALRRTTVVPCVFAALMLVAPPVSANEAIHEPESLAEIEGVLVETPTAELSEGESRRVSPVETLSVTTVDNGEVVHWEAASDIDVPPADAGRYPIWTQTGSGWSVQNKLVASGTTSWVRHYYALTKRTGGSGSYLTHVHGALSYDSDAGYQRNWIPVWSRFTNTCAGEDTVNGTSQTCMSPTFSWTYAGNDGWYNTSAHRYDHGNNGSWDMGDRFINMYASPPYPPGSWITIFDS